MEEKKGAAIDGTVDESAVEAAADVAAGEIGEIEREPFNVDAEAVGEASDSETDPEASGRDEDELEGTNEAQVQASDAHEEAEQGQDDQNTSSKQDAKKPNGKGVGDLVIVGILALILGVLLALPSFLGVTGGGEDKSGGENTGIAATVNGTVISESDITAYITDFREKQGLDSNDAWGEWMASYGYTVEGLRSDTIEYFVNRELLKQAIAAEGVSVEEEEVEKYIASITEQVGGEDAFNEALEMESLDLDTYREEIRFSLQQQALAEKVAGTEAEVDDAEVLEVVKMYFPDSVDKNAKTLDGVDADTVEQVRTMLSSSATQEAFSAWMDDYRSKAMIVIVDMPQGLPYAIDVAPYAQKLEREQADGEIDESEMSNIDEEDEEVIDVEELVDDEGSADDEASSSASSKSAGSQDGESN